MKKDKLVDFLNEMDKNDDLKQKYIKDPKGTAEAYGLDADDIKICEKGDVEAMKKRADAVGADVVSVNLTK